VSDPLRYEKVRAFLCGEQLVSARDVLVPRAATIADLSLVHSRDYLDGLQTQGALDRALPGLPPALEQEAIAWQRFMVGGTLLAARTALRLGMGGPPVVHLGGGLHHAYADHAQGFCIFNDVAVSIRALRQRGFRGKVLVIDLDLHQGNGTRAIFAQDESVFTLSVHARTLDADPAVANLDVELGPAVNDARYLHALAEHIPATVRDVRPDLVFYVAGVDVAHDDALGDWRVTPDAILARDLAVLEAAKNCPLVWVLAGGYGENAWRHTARSLTYLLSGRDTPIPSEIDKDLVRFRAIAGSIAPSELTGEPDRSGNFGITEADVFGDLAPMRGETRFLGYYSLYGIELALERYGVMQKLREQGFGRIKLQFDPSHPTGHLLRVYSDDERADLLVELVAREDKELAPWNLLAVEWLLLQNPRRAVDPRRPLLPGQRHPGLGCLREVMGMLAMACDRLAKDGLLYRPAHYHMAEMARPYMVFIHPEDEGRYLAIRRAVAGLGLAVATRAVAEGRVHDAHTGEPVRWVGAPMVLSSSPALREWTESAEYAHAVREASERLEVVLVTNEDALMQGRSTP
jgi:acetoin utilization deacetylase AcuC-like enzyme